MLKNIVCLFALFALFAGVGYGQGAASQESQDTASQEFQCLANAEVCIDAATTFTYVQKTASRTRYYPFILDGDVLLGAPANSHWSSHWSIDSDYTLGKDIVIHQLRYAKFKNAPNIQAAEISIQGEQYPHGRTGAAFCAGVGAYLSGTCAVRPTGTPVIVPNKSLYITADSEDSLHLESSDPDFIELRVSDRKTINCSSCTKRIEWYIQKDSKEERFFDKLFAEESFSRYSIQIAASGQTP